MQFVFAKDTQLIPGFWDFLYIDTCFRQYFSHHVSLSRLPKAVKYAICVYKGPAEHLNEGMASLTKVLVVFFRCPLPNRHILWNTSNLVHSAQPFSSHQVTSDLINSSVNTSFVWSRHWIFHNKLLNCSGFKTGKI
jgi:hypothetical protein